MPEKIRIPERQEQQPFFLSACKEIQPITENIAYYRNGVLYDVNPRNTNISLDDDRGVAYSARYIYSDGVKYDLESPESIKKITIPKFNENGYVTRDLSYILKMRAIRENRPALAVPLCYKVANLMIESPITWSKKDYFRLVIQLWSIGEIHFGDYLLAEMKKYVPVLSSNNNIFKAYSEGFVSEYNSAIENNYDYLQSSYIGSVCAECAIYQNRVFSISGNDKRFPKLPDFIIKNNGMHCPVSFYVFHYYDGCTLSQYICNGKDDYQCIDVDAIEYSNRPFVDDRTEYEKQCYEERKEKNENQKNSDALYYDREHWIEEYKEHNEYQQIVNLLGEKAPKNFNSYKRMKNNKTSTYQKLVDVAKENGIEL